MGFEANGLLPSYMVATSGKSPLQVIMSTPGLYEFTDLDFLSNITLRSAGSVAYVRALKGRLGVLTFEQPVMAPQPQYDLYRTPSGKRTGSGAGSQFLLAPSAFLSGNRPYTAAWLSRRRTVTSVRAAWAAGHDSTDQTIVSYVGSAASGFYRRRVAVNLTIPLPAFPLDTWQLQVETYSGTFYRQWLKTTLQGDGAINNSPILNNLALFSGSPLSSPNNITGEIAGHVLVDGVLSDVNRLTLVSALSDYWGV